MVVLRDWVEQSSAGYKPTALSAVLTECVERIARIELAQPTWKDGVLPLDNIRSLYIIIALFICFVKLRTTKRFVIDFFCFFF